MRITMIGTGYVGLVSGTCFAALGWDVTCVDIDAEKIRRLDEDNHMPIYEPGLAELVAKHRSTLSFTTDIASAVAESDVVFLAVGTPQGEDGSADLQYVYKAAEDVAKNLNGYTVIVDKSTVPVGTGEEVTRRIKAVNPSADFDVVSNPEFLREGAAISDFMRPDRVVIGSESTRAKELMSKLYAPIEATGAAILHTNVKTAELIKYAANGFLAMKITFINEMARLSEALGANVADVADGIGLDKRIGRMFLNPGPGYGGSCFPKDTAALAKSARDAGSPLSLIETTIQANKRHKEAMADKIDSALGGVKGKTIAALGLAFKANTDDMRDSPSLTILPELQKRGAIIRACDPEASANAMKLMDGITYTNSIQEALTGSDSAVVLTEWQDFKDLCPTTFASLSSKTVVDLRNIYSSQSFSDNGLSLISLGLPQTSPLTV